MRLEKNALNIFQIRITKVTLKKNHISFVFLYCKEYILNFNETVIIIKFLLYTRKSKLCEITIYEF